MTASRSRKAGKSIPHAVRFVWLPPSWVEYSYYFIFSYSIIAAYLGIEIPLIAAGLTGALAALCFIKLGSRRKEIYAPIALLLACVISFISIEILVYGASIRDEVVRTFILLICGLIIMRSLCLRPGFLLRCTLVIFALGLIAVPHIAYTTADVVDRASADIEIGGGLRNANGLAVWFGLCVVVFGIYALETKRGIMIRLLYSLAALGSLFVVGLTVSRGALIGCAVALTIGFRSVLKRGFVPVLLLIVLVGVALVSGLADPIISNFAERGTEETGRFLVWPLIIDRILASPIVGVGFSAIETYVPETQVSIVPHNSFLFFALASGIVPFGFYLVFWIRTLRNALFDVGGSQYNPFRIPLLLYALVAFMLANISTEPWALLAITVGAGARISRRKEGLSVTHRRIRFRRIARAVQIPTKVGTIRE